MNYYTALEKNLNFGLSLLLKKICQKLRLFLSATIKLDNLLRKYCTVLYEKNLDFGLSFSSKNVSLHLISMCIMRPEIRKKHLP